MPQSLVIAGGLAEKTPALIQHEEFFREFFKATGEQKAFLKNLPLWLAKHPLNGVWGAAQSGFMYALQRGMTES
jgi:glucokinase